MIVHKGKYEEALGVVRVERRKFLLFLPNFGVMSYFFQGELLWQQSIKGEEWRLTTNKGDCKNVTEPYLGGGKSNTHIPSEQNITVLGGITHSRVTFGSLENLVPAQVSASRRTESHKIQSNTTQKNATEMETN